MKFKLILIAAGISCSMFSQQKETVNDTTNLEHKVELKLDIVSRYLWRGQCWGGDYIAVQPTIEYALLPKLTLGFWGTTNFKKEYSYTDGTVYKGYQEIDFYATYQITDFLQFQLWDYYWPSVAKVAGVNNGYFNYGKNGVKTVDAILYFDFSEGYKFPFNATISTLVAGNDFRYDSNEEHPKQNFTTYLELGYTFLPFEKSARHWLQNIAFDPVIGVVLNNKAAYYNYADYDKVSFCNLGIKAIKEIDLGNGISMPLGLNFTHNAADKNTEAFGRDFVVGTLSFTY